VDSNSNSKSTGCHLVIGVITLNSTGPTQTPTPTRTSSPTSVQLATSRTCTTILADLSADFCPTRALFLARMCVGDARVYTCWCTVHDKLSCTRLQNYTIGASLMSVSVSVLWCSSLLNQFTVSHCLTQRDSK